MQALPPSILTMARSPVSYSQSQYYLPSPREESPYSTQPIILHHPHPVQPQPMQQPPHPDMSLDPSMMYGGGYYPYQQQTPQHMIPPHLNMTASLSSPSSHGSEMGAGTPPMEHFSLSGPNSNGKRPASSLDGDIRKRSRKDDDGEPSSPSVEKSEEVKTKPTRGSRYVAPIFPQASIELMIIIAAPALYVDG